MTRVVRMNESTSDNLDNIPLPARQQLGIYNETIDVDARNRNGVRDRVELQSSDRRDYDVLAAEDGGSRVHQVTYHLDTTPPPVEPAGAPGSKEYNNARGTDGVALNTQGSATTARQSDDGFVTTQRESAGRNERIAASLGMDNHASVEAGSDSAAQVVSSPSVSDVPTGTVAQVMDWVGDDADRARQAEAQENKRENPRQSLLNRLAEVK